MDMNTLINALNQNFNQVQSQDRRKVITDENGNDRIIIGKQTDGKYNIRVSQVGKDVDTAGLDDLVLNGDNNLFKIVETDTITLDAPVSPNGSSYVNVTHSVGHSPTVIAYASFSATGTPHPLPYLGIELVSPTPGIVNYSIDFEDVGDDTITFFWRKYAGTVSGTAYIRYYIIQETASYQ